VSGRKYVQSAHAVKGNQLFVGKVASEDQLQISQALRARERLVAVDVVLGHLAGEHRLAIVQLGFDVGKRLDQLRQVFAIVGAAGIQHELVMQSESLHDGRALVEAQ
jgi:hypothetical protein